jgi:hypothetical protein
MARRALIFVHRWLGVALCLLFLLWFPSGIVMMYWPFPDVSPADRLEHATALDASAIALLPDEAVARLGLDDQEPRPVRLNTFDGRPVYRIRGGGRTHVVYADTGEVRDQVTLTLMRRIAARWTGQPEASATDEPLTEADQWTVQNYRNIAPVRKFSWPDGQQVYVSENSGEVVQATTRGSRLWAYLGAIPHWFYFTPLRKHGPEWSRTVIWTSAVGTATAVLGLIIGVWMYSPSKRYRHAGLATAIPYRGQKRLHTILGLLFGLGAVTWAFSGMLSMEPFPLSHAGDEQPPTIPAFREPGRLTDFGDTDPRAVLARLPAGAVKELEFTSFAGAPVYFATLAGDETRVIPPGGSPQPEFDRARSFWRGSTTRSRRASTSIRRRQQLSASTRPVTGCAAGCTTACTRSTSPGCTSTDRCGTSS